MKRVTKSYGERTDKAMQTWMNLVKLHHKVHTKELNYFLAHDITMNQFKVLEVLYHRGSLSIGAVTKLTLSTPGNITVVVRNLKRDGFIKSVKDEKDKRTTLLEIAPKGAELIQAVFPEHANNLKTALDILDEEELKTLNSLLRKAYKAN